MLLSVNIFYTSTCVRGSKECWIIGINFIDILPSRYDASQIKIGRMLGSINIFSLVFVAPFDFACASVMKINLV